MKKKYVPYGSDVSAGEFKCADCGYRLTMRSTQHLPPCPDFSKRPHKEKGWKIITGTGDSKADPFPEKDEQ